MSSHRDVVVDDDRDVLPAESEGSRDQMEANDDAALLRTMGYKPVLHRTYTLLENFSTTFAALYFIGGVRVTFSTGIAAGGNLAYWTSYLVTMVFTFITAAVIAEVCSASPAAGSIYLWAAEAGGPRFGRLLGFVVAWWSTTAWTTFCASNTQAAVNYMLSELTVFNVDFPTDASNVKFRAVQWICTEVLLALAALINFLPPKKFRYVFYLSSAIVLLDFFLNLIWFPIGAHSTWGFRSAHEAFMTTYNGTGAPAGWNWCLSYLATAGILIGFDASGHVAEETKNASVTAARGIFWSTVVSGFGGLATIILFLFCAPKPDTLFSFGSPQPFVPLYAAVLGKGGHIFMNIVCIVALWFNTAIAIVAASRLVFAVARDGVLPFSGWVSRVSEHGQPRNAVIVVWAVAALVTCTILPSMVAFTSLISAAGVPSAAAYGLICLCRLVLTPKRFPKPRWSLGRWSKPFQFIGVFWNAWVVAVLFSPYEFPVSGETLNYAPIIMAGVTIFALISYWVTPEEAWLPRNRISHFIDSKGVSDESSNSNNDNDNKNSNDNTNVNASINKTTDDKL
ncbi:amino acid permease [Thermoascus aurantiacus ATCC 26904]